MSEIGDECVTAPLLPQHRINNYILFIKQILSYSPRFINRRLHALTIKQIFIIIHNSLSLALLVHFWELEIPKKVKVLVADVIAKINEVPLLIFHMQILKLNQL